MTQHCVVSTKHKLLKFSEKRSSFVIVNDKQQPLIKKQVDGCLITSGKRCDWLVIDPVTQAEIYIELKGSDVLEAVKQICATIKVLTAGPVKKVGYIICTRCPVATTEVQAIQKMVFKKFGVILRVRTSAHTENLDRVLLG